MKAKWLLRGACLLVLSLGLVSSHSRSQGPEPKIAVEKIKYAELGKLIRNLKGKVIVVDFWAEF